MTDLIFNVFAADYHLIASFTDADLCKKWLSSNESYHTPAWVGVFKANEMARTVPMWPIEDFGTGFPHKK